MHQKSKEIENFKHCLGYLDNQLEKTSEQTIGIAELMILDMNNLIENSKELNQKEYIEKVKETHLSWITKLSEIILAQSNRDLSGQVIIKLNDFLDKAKLKTSHKLELPSHVLRELDILEPKDAIDNSSGILSQEEIDEVLKTL